MRELRTAAALAAEGITRDRIKWALKTRRWTLIIRGVYGRGPDTPSPMDILRATALATGGALDAVATAQLGGWDGVERWGPHVLVAANMSGKRGWTRRVRELPTRTVEEAQVPSLLPADALRELADVLDDIHWEQALEYCLRKTLVTPNEIAEWHHARVRRVIRLRGGLLVPPTESLLETLAVQLIRQDPRIPRPVRQFTIYDADGNFVGRPDLCWPDLASSSSSTGRDTRTNPSTTPTAKRASPSRRAGAAVALRGSKCANFRKRRSEISPRWSFRLQSPDHSVGSGVIGNTAGSGPVVRGSSPLSPAHIKVPSSRGLGHHPLKVATRVRIPLGLLNSRESDTAIVNLWHR